MRTTLLTSDVFKGVTLSCFKSDISLLQKVPLAKLSLLRCLAMGPLPPNSRGVQVAAVWPARAATLAFSGPSCTACIMSRKRALTDGGVCTALPVLEKRCPQLLCKGRRTGGYRTVGGGRKHPFFKSFQLVRALFEARIR